MIYLKFISRLIRFFKSLLTNTQLSNHKFQNKNQVTNANIILSLLKNKNYSGHSLRSGFATVAAESGADERSIMAMTGHKTTQMVRR